jgi:DNA mismatch repair protein MutS
VVEILAPEGFAIPDCVTRGAEPDAPRVMVTVRAPWCFDQALGRERLTKHFGTVSLDPYDAEDLGEALGAAAALLDYLTEMRGSAARHVTGLVRLRPRSAMTLDAATLTHLDIVPRRGEGADGTLFGVLDATRTPMGARLLRGWLARPSLELAEIEGRQRAVAALAEDDARRTRLRTALGRLGDLDRLAGRVEAGKGGARELRAIAEALTQIPALAGELGAEQIGEAAPLLTELRGALDAVPELRDLILAQLVDAPPLSIAEGGLFRDGVDAELDEAREAARSGKSWIADLEAEERRRTGIAKLKIGFNKVFGYYLEVTRSQLDAIPEDYIRKQTLVNAERFITPGLKEMESKVLGAEERIARIEQRLFLALRERTTGELGRILGTARAAQLLDVLAALAETARAKSYVCPQVIEDGELEILAGRHPVVDDLMAEEGFVPNDTRVGGDGAHVLIITGPNMAGKSTYLRQVGLITLLAQIGSFVPAESARIPLTDRIFTRVGAADRIASGQSTFLVEMNETAVILHHASERSLVLLDEIGRGTSTYDGLAIAWAVTEHLHGRQPAPPRTLFATHYHELTALADELPGVANLNVAVDESGGRVTFLHRIVAGAADRSYGIHVAELAGLPDAVIRRARALLERLERGEGVGRSGGAVQLGLFGWPPPAPVAGATVAPGAAAETAAAETAEAEEATDNGAERPAAELEPELAAARRLLGELAGLDLDGLRPLDALTLLDRWRRELAGEEE